MNLSDQTKKVKEAVMSQPLSYFEFLFFNSPEEFMRVLREMGLTRSVLVNREEAGAVIRRIVARNEVDIMNDIVSSFRFNHDANNFTSNENFWNAFGVPYGDTKQLFTTLTFNN